jgi:acyl dehydratase
MTGDPVFFEDFQPGQRFESAPRTMDRDRLVAFAAEFDPQPQHLGEAEAAGSMFGTLVASGWHTAALTMRMQLDILLGRIPGGGMGAQVDRLAWRRPVGPGDRLRAVIEVLAVRESRSRPDRGLVTLRTTTLNQRDEAVMEMEAAVLMPRRPRTVPG